MNVITTLKQQLISFFALSGQLAIASFLVCIATGVALAIPYDVSHPFESVSLLVLTNPWASLFRNLHYWSAQLFTILSLVHLVEHERRRTTQKIRNAVWIRLTISIPIIFFVMLSGFILKADADALQACQIIGSLFLQIPSIGQILKHALLGQDGSFQVLYVHHIATASIFLLIIIIEHAKQVWPRASLMFPVLLITTALSFFLQAPLHDGLSDLLKGPWYFIGLQEIMHFTTYPIVLWFALFVFFGLVFWLPKSNGKRYSILSKIMLGLLIAYALVSLHAFFFRGANWAWEFQRPRITGGSNGVKWNPIWPTDTTFRSNYLYDANSKKESCLGCHAGMKGLSESHNPEAIGCASCHGGNPWATTANNAHRNVRLIPGNLTDAKQSCGQQACHQQITTNIHTGLMATLSGMISVDKWVFGELNSPDKTYNVNGLGNSSADEHLKNLCVGCHLGSQKTLAGTSHYLEKGGGCLACHLNYAPELDKEVKDYYAKKTSKLPGKHPNLTLHVTDDKCFTCHNRSGRIATNYQGWSETRLDTAQAKNNPTLKIIEKNRVFTKQTADVHHVAGINCIDCHTAFELMGDGNLFKHQEDAVKTRCADCHTTKKLIGRKLVDMDRISQNIIALNQYLDKNANYLKQTASEANYTNVVKDSLNKVWLTTKNTGKKLPIKPSLSVCTSTLAHKTLSCNACHAAWAPSCLGCHNTYDTKAPGYNHLLKQEQTGTWIEHVGMYDARPPTLGIRMNGNLKEIIPFVPGMVLSIDQSAFKTSNPFVFKRLFAPVAPHTSQRSRSCTSCHANPVALGYGDGELTFEVDGGKGRWKFEPKFATNKYDNLPEDAWINFLKPTPQAVSTRLYHRPFTVEEQKAILLVGSCLSCHSETSQLMQQSLSNWTEVLKKRKKACIEPSY